MGSRLGNSRE
jgi:hypothetical protein